jgi:hypothetical protein
MEPPLLAAPQEGEQLLLYVAGTTHVINTTIVVEHVKEGHVFKVQRPVYFISEVLFNSKVCYPPIQKLLYTILITSQKLHHYFKDYNILVVTNFPLADIHHNRDTTSRISKWEIELGALSITSSHPPPSSRKH